MSHVEMVRKQVQEFSRILGVITLLVLGRMTGYNGIAYLAAAVEILSVFLILFADSVPDVLGRMLRMRMSKGQFKDAERIRSSVLIFQSVLGVLAGVLLFFLADVLAESVFRVPYAALALKILAPVLILRILSGVLLGYFQGNGSQMPTVAVCVLRQIFILMFGLLFVRMLRGYGEKVSLLLLNEDLPSMYGAAGFALAMAVAEILILLFLLVIYLGSRQSRKGQQEGLKRTVTFRSAVGILYGGMFPQVLLGVLAGLPVWVGIMAGQRKAEDIYGSAWEYGVYYGGYLALCAIPVLLCSILMLFGVRRTTICIRKDEQRFARDAFGAVAHAAVVSGMFVTAFYTAMAPQIAAVFCGKEAETAEEFLRMGAMIVPEALCLLSFNRILMYTGRMKQAVCSMGICTAVYTVSCVIGLNALNMGVKGLVAAGVAAGAAGCIAAGFFLWKRIRVKIDWLYWIAVPVGAALVTGGICFLVGKFMTAHLGELVTMIVGLVLGLVVYGGILTALKDFSERETDALFGGTVLQRLAEITGVFGR